MSALLKRARRCIVPRIEWSSWGGDGMHSQPRAHTWVDGRSLSIAWLGLHFEIIVAVERAQ